MGRNHLSVCQILKKLRIILACRDITYPVAALELFNAIGSNKRKSFTNNYIRVIAKAEAGPSVADVCCERSLDAVALSLKRLRAAAGYTRQSGRRNSSGTLGAEEDHSRPGVGYLHAERWEQQKVVVGQSGGAVQLKNECAISERHAGPMMQMNLWSYVVSVVGSGLPLAKVDSRRRNLPLAVSGMSGTISVLKSTSPFTLASKAV